MLHDFTMRGDAGVAIIHRAVSQMGHVWHERGLDAGIDGTIELRDSTTSEMSNRHIFVQSKATERLSGETETHFHYVCKERDIAYWMKADEPVILVVSRPSTDEAWWVHVQSWFEDPGHRASRRVDFNKEKQRFAGDITARLFAVADPYGQAHTPVADHRAETLVSNMLPVEIPDVFYSALTSVRTSKAVWEAQRKSSSPSRLDFVLRGGRVYSWSRISGTGLARVADAAPTMRPVGELESGDADNRRLLVHLLNQGLKQDLHGICRWHQGRKFLYVRPSQDLSEFHVGGPSGRGRLAFKGYPVKKDPSRIAYYKHAALDWSFTDVNGSWFCLLRPDYLYTVDGKHESPYADDNLAGIKRLERNAAVLGETRLWETLLRSSAEPTLLNEAENILDFGPLMTFDLDRGIDDKTWAARGGFDGDQRFLDFEDAE